MQQRVGYIDGLRGLACMQVVLFHSGQFISVPLGLAADGPLGVSVFFLISGFVLTLGFTGSAQPIHVKITSRFIRLVLPSIISIFIAALILLIRGQYRPAMADSTWTGILQCLTYHTIPALGTFTVITLNPPLWTICVELWGSMLILLLTEGRKRSRPVYLAVAISAFFIPGLNLLSLFVIGHLLAIAWPARGAGGKGLSFATQAIGLSLLLAGGLVSQRHSFDPALFSRLHLPNFAPYEIGAMLIFSGALMSAIFQKLCNTPLVRFIGKISFPLYLLHWPVLQYLGLPLYAALFPLLQKWTAIAAYVIVLAVLILSAALFQRYIDQTMRKFIVLALQKKPAMAA